MAEKRFSIKSSACHLKTAQVFLRRFPVLSEKFFVQRNAELLSYRPEIIIGYGLHYIACRMRQIPYLRCLFDSVHKPECCVEIGSRTEQPVVRPHRRIKFLHQFGCGKHRRSLLHGQSDS